MIGSATGRSPSACAAAIVALGNFDGFHLGHQAVVGAGGRARRAPRGGRRSSRPSIRIRCAIFEPDVPPFRLTTLDQRERLFAAAGADAMLVFHFDAELAAITAEDFVARAAGRAASARRAW